MAPPIVDVIDSSVFVNGTILASELFTAIDTDDEITSYMFQDFLSSAKTGYFSLNGVAYDNGSTFTIAASDLPNLTYSGGSQISYEGFRVIARDQVGNFSDPNQIGRLSSVRSNTTQPHVAAPKFTLLANEFLSGDNFIKGFDPDGYPLTKFRIQEANKVTRMVAGNDVVTVSSYQHRFKQGQMVTIKGANQSAFNVTAKINVINDHVFKYTVAGIGNATATGAIRASTVNNGYFELDGIRFAQGESFTITAEQVPDLQYHTSGPDAQENFYLQGFDGVDWSYDKKGVATTLINANAPVVRYSRATTPADQLLNLDGKFEVSDSDGNSIKTNWFYNTSPHSQNGDLIFKGVVQERKKWFAVKADEMDQLFFKTGRVGFGQQIRIVANDGLHSSAPGTLLISSTEPIVRPEIEVNDLVVISEQLREVDIVGLFSKTDPGPAHSRVQVYEPTQEANSGTLRYAETPLQGGIVHEFSKQQFDSRVNFYTGDFYVRNLDTVYVRSFSNDSQLWGKWAKIDIRTEPEYEDVLTSGTTWQGLLPRNSVGKLEIPYSFMQSFPDYETGEAEDGDPLELRHFEIFNARQRENARIAFRQIEQFANVQFVEVADSITNSFGGKGGIIRMGEYGIPAPESGAAAFAFYPGFDAPPGDIWLNRLNWLGGPFGPQMDLEQGTWGFKVFMHELGHAMGLKHPHDGNPRLPPETDVNDFSVMSYNQAQTGEPTTYQLYDVNELQDLYGANQQTRTGDTTYSIAGFWGGRTQFVETIWDAGGNDTLSAVGAPSESVVDLRAGQRSTIGDFPGNVNIAFDVEIENGIGSSFDDELFGNSKANVLVGGNGNDYLYGNAGNDMLEGGAGHDIFEWGVGDGDDTINENGLGGRDQIRISEFPGVNELQDFRFSLQGRDLMIDLHLDGSLENSMRIVNQVYGGYRVESLELGGTMIDLVNITSQVAPGTDTFRVTSSTSSFGLLVAPV